MMSLPAGGRMVYARGKGRGRNEGGGKKDRKTCPKNVHAGTTSIMRNVLDCLFCSLTNSPDLRQPENPFPQLKSTWGCPLWPCFSNLVREDEPYGRMEASTIHPTPICFDAVNFKSVTSAKRAFVEPSAHRPGLATARHPVLPCHLSGYSSVPPI
ncbi:MAG: hypothetical protein ACRD27_09745 [Terracidiphilus sp.]